MYIYQLTSLQLFGKWSFSFSLLIRHTCDKHSEVARKTGSLSKNIMGLCYEHRGNDTWSLDPTFRSRRNGILNANYTSAIGKSLFEKSTLLKSISDLEEF